MARNLHQLHKERESRSKNEWMSNHHQYLENTKSFRKYGGTPDSTGKVHNLERNPKGHALTRKINSPRAKTKRSLRRDAYEGHDNNFTNGILARMKLQDHKRK